MLDQGDKAAFGFELSIDAWMDVVREARSPRPVGTAGGYEFLAEVSRGGQGLVYRARHVESGKDVAIKRLLDGRNASTTDRLRFEREIETASRIRHPSLVSVQGRFEAEGLRYLVMDWIDGIPINRWPRAADGVLRQERDIIQLMIRVGEAVHHAHQRGIIHRDLKPSNILVDAEDRPNILDFGLARPIRENATVTDAGQFVGTLAYASPEQLRSDSDSNDVLTDVFSLGVILYELLTGRLPHRRGKRLGEVIQGLPREDVVRPTTVVSQFSRNLEAIVLKALAREKQSRYQSVEAFVEDLRRYLTGDPISARPFSRWSILWAAMRRNRLVVTFAVTVFVLVSGFAILATVQRDTARTERLRATEQAKRATALSEFIRDMFASIDPRIAKGKDVALMRSILDRTSARIDDEFAGQAESLAEIHTTVGLAYRSIGEFDQSEVHLRTALQARRSSPGAVAASLAKCEIDLAELGHIQGRYDESERLFRAALTTARRDTDVSTELVALAKHGLARLLCDVGRFDDAEALFSEALQTRRNASDQAAVADSLNGLGELLTLRGRHDEALNALSESLEIRRRELDSDAPEVAECLSSIASISVQRGDYAAAVPRLEEALEIYRRYLGDDHLDIAHLKLKLGEALWHASRMEEAERAFLDALDVGEASLGSDHSFVAEVLTKLAEFQAYVKLDNGAAVESLQRAISIQRSVFGDVHVEVANSLQNLATIAYSRRDFETAETQYREALRIRETLLGPRHNQVASARFFLAHILIERGDFAGTIEECDRALDAWTEGLSERDPRVVGALTLMAQAELRLGRPEKAEPLLRRAIEIQENSPVDEHFSIMASRIALGTCLIDLGRHAEAKQALQACLREAEAKWGDTPDLAERVQRELDRLHAASDTQRAAVTE